jgi:UMF1 family MFS transporter
MEADDRTINKKNVVVWTLYDFGKSVVIITFALYFSQWLVTDKGVGDFWYNMIFVAASILLFATAPVFAIIADKRKTSLPYLRFAGVFLFISTLAVGIFSVLSIDHAHFVLYAAICFIFSSYFYQFSLIFYNAFLQQLAPPEKQGLVSGIGYAFNWIGQIAGLAISLPFAYGYFYLFGEVGRAQTLIPVTFVFLVLGLPMLFSFEEKNKPVEIKINYKDEYKNFLKEFITVCKLPGVGRFLLAFFLFNDAILTLENNFAIYLQAVFHIDDKTKSLLLLGVLITAALGSFLSGWLGDKIGLKKSLLFILGGTVILFPVLAFAGSFAMFSFFAVLTGLVYGASWTIARAILTHLAPKDKVNHIFSYYSLIERFATFVGPLAWGLTIYWLNNTGIFKYKVSLIILDVFILIGAIVVAGIPSDKIT